MREMKDDRLNTSTHVLILYSATSNDPAYFTLTDKRRVQYATPQLLTEEYKLEVRHTPETGSEFDSASAVSSKPIDIYLGGQPIGSVDNEESYNEVARFVARWQLAIAGVAPDVSAPRSSSSARRESVEDIRKHDLQSHRDRIVTEKMLSMRVVTWNVQGMDLSHEDLSELLTGTRNEKKVQKDQEENDGDGHKNKNQDKNQSTDSKKQLSSKQSRKSSVTKTRWPDLIVVCLQEADSLSRNVYASSATLSSFTTNVLNTLNADSPSEYCVVASNQLVGLLMVVVCTQELSEQLIVKSKSTTGTGLFGVLGNKGACGLSLVIGHEKEIPDSGTELVLVNCHLAAGEDKDALERRKWDLNEIGKNFGFAAVPSHSHSRSFDSDAAELSLEDISVEEAQVKEYEKAVKQPTELVAALGNKKKPLVVETGEGNTVTPVREPTSGQFTPVSPSPTSPSGQQLNHDVPGSALNNKIWLLSGDLNFRLLMKKELVEDFLSMKDYETLVVEDSLLIQRKENRLLRDFVEGEIRFAPTYRYHEDTLDYQRTPSYCDRILYKEKPLDRDGKLVEQHEYGSIPSYTISDHKPVFACYSIRTSWIDFTQRKSIVDEALKKHDHRENSSRPEIEVDSLDISGPPDAMVLKEQEALLTLRSTEGSQCLGHWEISCLNPDIKIEPEKGVLPVGATQKVTVKYTMRVEDSAEGIEDILVVKILHVKDIFVTVKFKTLKTCLATPLDVLCRATNGIQRELVPADSPVQFEIPKPFLECVRYLDQHDCRDIFTKVWHPQKFSFNPDDQKANLTLLALCQQVQSWMDDASNFDYEVLHEANRYEKNIGTLAVAQQLLLFIYYIPGKLIHQDLYEDSLHTSPLAGAANLWTKIDMLNGKCLSLLCEFLHNVIVKKRHESRRVIIDVFEPLLFAVPAKFHDNKSMFTLREERNSRRTLLSELIMKSLIA